MSDEFDAVANGGRLPEEVKRRRWVANTSNERVAKRVVLVGAGFGAESAAEMRRCTKQTGCSAR